MTNQPHTNLCPFLIMHITVHSSCCSLTSSNACERDCHVASFPMPLEDWEMYNGVTACKLQRHPVCPWRMHTYCLPDFHVPFVSVCCRSPHHGDVFASASGDTTVRLWDLRQPMPTLLLPAHSFEVLTTDWCKYNDCIIATGSIDKTIKVWDVRMPQKEMTTLFGHTYVHCGLLGLFTASKLQQLEGLLVSFRHMCMGGVRHIACHVATS